jgi:hypothetical protein
MSVRVFDKMSREASGSIAPIHMPKLLMAIMLVASTILLTSLACFNGFPLVTGDTGAYIIDALGFLNSFRINWARPVFYSLFILPLHLRLSVWPIVFAQGLIVAHLLFITLRVTNQKQQVPSVSFFVVILILTMCTSLPWFIGQIMADVFTGIVILGLFLLGFSLDRLTRLEIVYIFFLTTGAISFHYSHIPLAFGLVVVTVALQLLLHWHDWFRVKKLSLLIGPIMLAASALMALNIVGSRQITLSLGSPIFLLARLIEDGTARMYLDEACPEREYALCPYRDELSFSWRFLWGQDSTLKKAGGAWKLRAEASQIVWGSLRAYPVQQLHKSLQNFSKQFVSFSTGAGLEPRLEGSHTNTVILNVFGPSVHAHYVASRQNTGKLPIVTAEWLHNITIVLSIPVVVFLFVYFSRRKEFLYVSFFTLILFGLIGNAFITGALSVVYSRYQSRVIWLIVFYAIVGSLQMLRGYSLPPQPYTRRWKTGGSIKTPKRSSCHCEKFVNGYLETIDFFNIF